MRFTRQHQHTMAVAQVWHGSPGLAVALGTAQPTLYTVVLHRCTSCIHADTVTLPGRWTQTDLTRALDGSEPQVRVCNCGYTGTDLAGHLDPVMDDTHAEAVS